MRSTNTYRLLRFAIGVTFVTTPNAPETLQKQIDCCNMRLRKLEINKKL